MTDPWPAPAKLNLFLHINGRRPDGYHELQTVFQFLSVCDDIHLETRRDGVIRLRTPLRAVPPDQDLTVRAARLLQQAGDTGLGVDIAVRKRLPMGGGLGGGSSDAATVLVALNHLWALAKPEDQLAELGLTLGADVPVFVRGTAAWAEGVGEQLTPVSLPEPWYLVLVPNCEISTAAVFSDPELTRDSPLITISAFRSGGGRNDCESVVRRRYPPVARAMDVLSEAGVAKLTGTGGCVFAAFPDRDAAEAAREHCRQQGVTGFTARGLNSSPLLHRLRLARAGSGANAGTS
ncbi:MAG: 4-(cytidine 5'-diphospho)-2-C-methyl-D-erythritol kinase [Ectothiorhodospiraceae bacterium]|nr:4-(cytidine 5'-diphospho)-2-C-methyl-D-erythritol kinase [Ectothiorhodospiraceae bacterium]MCH8505436.1 4-(cytidine 5'-diphospho)-2-C-methyl-D-erythritol kinase [Ectothiorhodospiraceae bacterium]